MCCDTVLHKMEECGVWEPFCLPMYVMFIVVTSECAQVQLRLKPGKGGGRGE